jgi:hypothetical protein
MLALAPEDKGHGNISLATYCKYLMAGGNILVLILTLVLFSLAEVRNSIIVAYCKFAIIAFVCLLGWNCCLRLVAI